MVQGVVPAPPITRLLALYAETALHPGSGSSTGVIDLPIQRERHTGFPIVPASSLKGSLRERAEQTWSRADARVAALFGPDVGAGEGLHAGAIGFGEARLVAFPVRSTSQVFVWVSCPLVLERLRRDLALAGLALPPLAARPANNDQALVPIGGGLSASVVLEDLSFDTAEQADLQAIAVWLADRLLPDGHAEMRRKLAQHLVLISDESYEHLVRVATEVTARIKLNDRKTTTGEGGNLWYEETLPRDCIFTAVTRLETPRQPATQLSGPTQVAAALDALLSANPFVQLGGNETVGQGWCVIRTVA